MIFVVLEPNNLPLLPVKAPVVLARFIFVSYSLCNPNKRLIKVPEKPMGKAELGDG